MARETRNPFISALRGTFGLLIGGYALVVTGFWLARWLIGESWMPVALYNSFAHLLWLGALVLLVVALLFRFWRVALLLLLPAASFVWVYGGQFIGERAAAYPGVPLTVMTYNILWRDSTYRDVLEVIRSADADVVGLQELGVEASAILEAALSDDYPYRALYPNPSGVVGVGIFSRYPISEPTYWESDFLPWSFGHQRAVINVDGIPVVVYNIHLQHPFLGPGFFNVEDRGLQVTDLLERIEAERSRVILMGDFNLTELSEDYARLDESLGDAFFSAGQGLGWTYSYGRFRAWLPPQARLDYIFYNTFGIDAVDARVWPNAGGSDHHPVWASLSLFDPSASYPPN